MASLRALPVLRRPQLAVNKRRHLPTIARAGGDRGGGVLDNPGYEIRRQGWDTDRDGAVIGGDVPASDDHDHGGVDRVRYAPPGGGNYYVLLLKSPSHTEKAVIEAITQVIPGTNEGHARNCFATSMSLGMAIVVSVLKEHAEFYAEQLYRLGCKTAIEPDSSIA